MIGIGIVGLPNVGKSTLFNAITKTQNAEAANYPFATIRDDSRLYDVSMPSNQSIKYGNIEHNFTNEEQVAYELAKTNTANFADFIMKTYEKIR